MESIGEYVENKKKTFFIRYPNLKFVISDAVIIMYYTCQSILRYLEY